MQLIKEHALLPHAADMGVARIQLETRGHVIIPIGGKTCLYLISYICLARTALTTARRHWETQSQWFTAAFLPENNGVCRHQLGHELAQFMTRHRDMASSPQVMSDYD